MALYTELYAKGTKDIEFIERCIVAVTVLASAVVSEQDDKGSPDPPIEDQEWAAQVLNSPRRWGASAASVVLALNKDVDISVIDAADDANLQSNVDKARAILVAGRDKAQTSAPAVVA